MKVFLSWSKTASQQLALILRDWLPEVNQRVDPWISSEDIAKGQRWIVEVGSLLDETSEGIICVTRENVREPWLNFEAGALAKSLNGGRVRPLLLDLRPTDITGPLVQFQATIARDRDDMLKLVQSLNAACDVTIPDDRLLRSFDRLWPEYLERLEDISSVDGVSEETHRGSDDILIELLERTRSVERLLVARYGSGGRRLPTVALDKLVGEMSQMTSKTDVAQALSSLSILDVRLIAKRVAGPSSPIARISNKSQLIAFLVDVFVDGSLPDGGFDADDRRLTAADMFAIAEAELRATADAAETTAN